jgi:phosphoglycolate phosphatase-like HAD superfamily hydrolase
VRLHDLVHDGVAQAEAGLGRIGRAVPALEDALGPNPATSVLIGDQISDIDAAHRAGVWAIGYANKLGKDSRLKAAGADAIITDLSVLVAGFLREPVPELPHHDINSDIELT